MKQSLSEKSDTRSHQREMYIPLLGPFPLLRVNAAKVAKTTNPNRTSMTLSAHHCAGLNRQEGRDSQLWLRTSESLQKQRWEEEHV
jgi:hypothetical protein